MLGFAIVLMSIASLLGYRHYKLEAEINSMTWKVNWLDVMPCYQVTRTRGGGSMHSLVKRGSQAVGTKGLPIVVGLVANRERFPDCLLGGSGVDTG